MQDYKGDSTARDAVSGGPNWYMCLTISVFGNVTAWLGIKLLDTEYACLCDVLGELRREALTALNHNSIRWPASIVCSN